MLISEGERFSIDEQKLSAAYLMKGAIFTDNLLFRLIRISNDQFQKSTDALRNEIIIVRRISGI